MKTLIPTLCAAVLALSPMAAGAAQAASPVTVTQLPLTMSAGSSVLDDLVQVQQRRHPYDRRGAQRHGDLRQGFDHRGRRAHTYRPPVRQHTRSGPDLGSALVGALVGGIIVNQIQQSGHHRPQGTHHGGYLSRNHLDWCQNRWRSYRLSDNSYQPYNGPRRICVSPHGPS